MKRKDFKIFEVPRDVPFRYIESEETSPGLWRLLIGYGDHKDERRLVLAEDLRREEIRPAMLMAAHCLPTSPRDDGAAITIERMAEHAIERVKILENLRRVQGEGL